MATLTDLERVLHRIDRRGYRAYREIEGRWSGDGLRGPDPSPELALPRSFELAAAIDRLRALELA